MAGNSHVIVQAVEELDGKINNQGTALDEINNKTPELGQALEAASVPVVLTAAQISTLTPPAAITGFATAANQASLLAAINYTPIMRMQTYTIGASVSGEVDLTLPATISDVTAINVAAQTASTNSAAVLVGFEDDVDNGLGIYIAPSNYEGKPIKVNPAGWKAVGTDGDKIIVAFFGTAVV